MKMKRYTQLIFLMFILISGTLAGQDKLNESFDETVFPPTEWTQTQISGTGLWYRAEIGYDPNCSPHSGEGMAFFDCYNYPVGTSAILISSSLDLSLETGFLFEFWMYRDNGYPTNTDKVDIYINTQSNLNEASLLGTINRSRSLSPAASSDGWYQYSFDIPSSFNGTDNYIIIQGTSGFGNNIFIDDIRVFKPVSPDSPPINFSASSVTQSGITVNWVDNSTNELGFRVFISTDDVNYTQYGSDIISTSQALTGDNYSQNITDLLPGTTYYFRISAYVDSESEFLTGLQATLPPDEIISITTGNWNDPTTWSTSTIPSSIDDVTISDGHTVTLNTSGAFNDLTVDGTLSLQAFSLSGMNVTINETGIINIIDGTTANLTVTNDIINNGVFDFYTSDVIFGRTTFSGTNPQTFTATGTTNIGNITINKGTSRDNLVEIIANGTFTIKSGIATGFLTLSNGTIKISGNASVSNNVFTEANSIPSTAGFWLNNPNFIVLDQSNSNTIVSGLLRISSGTYNVGKFANQNLAANTGAIFIVDGGTLNVSGRFITSNAISFTISGGAINVSTLGNTGSNLASFGLTNASNTINISGGEINLVQANSNSTVNNRLDYNINGSTLNISGGNLNIGTSTTATNFGFRIRSTTPNIVIDNTTNVKTALLVAETTVMGNITVTNGATLNLQTSNLNLKGNINQIGNLINNGFITCTSATGSNRFNFVGEHGAQTLSGTGTFGNSTTPFAGIVFSNSSGVTVESTVVTNRVNLLNGLVTGANNITFGNGVSSSPVTQRGGSSSLIVGSFDVAPVISSGALYGVTYSTGLEAYTPGVELPALIEGTLELSTNFDITLGASTAVKKLSFSATNTGKLITTEINLLTVTGTLPSDVTLTTGNTGYVQGPLARTLPASLASGSTYQFPIGKGSANYFELVNPTTTADGSVVIKTNVFDISSGGTDGPNIIDGSLGNRYWVSEITTGITNFANTSVKVTQTSPALVPENVLAQSTTLTGEYHLVSSNPPADNSLTSNAINSLGYFAIGVQEPTVGGIVLGSSTICEGQTSELLTLSNYIGQIIRWEGSVSPFTDWTTIAYTDPTYTSGALTETTRFRAVVKSGVYDEEVSDYTEVVVDPTTVGGAVTGGTTICAGETSSQLTLSGYTGTILRWESSVSPFTEWVAIENALETYTSGALTETTLFRAVVQSGVCDILESDFTTVIVNPIPVPTISTSDGLVYCEGDPISVNFTIDITGDSYQWLLDGLLIESALSSTLNATTPGIYSVEVTIDGCTGVSNEIEIIANPIPAPTIQTLDEFNICGEDPFSILFTIDIIGDSYQWFVNGTEILGATNETYTATEAGIYSVEVTNNGCTGTSNELTVTVNPIPEPTISTLNQLIYCEGEAINVEFTIDITGDSYQWLLNGIVIVDAINSTFTATEGGVYSVEVTTNGCTGISNEIEIVENPLPVPTISTIDETNLCDGQEVSIVFTIDITGDTYQWLLNGINIDEATQAAYTATEAGTYSVEVTTDGCTGISNEISIAIYPIPEPIISSFDNLIYCEDEEISTNFTIDITGDSYQWLLNGLNIDGATLATHTATEAGTYSVEVTTNGCTGVSNEIEVVVNPVPAPTIATANDITFCEGETVSGEFTIDIAGDSYQWLLDGVNIDGANQATFSATVAGTYSVEVTTDGCTGVSNEINVVVNPLPAPTIATVSNTSFCEGETFSVDFTINITGDSYQWVLNGINIDGATQATFSATVAGTYSVEVTTEGCTGVSNEIEVVVNPLPAPIIATTSNTSFCEGETVTVDLTTDITGDSYQWLLDGVNIDGATQSTYTATEAGAYSVEVTQLACVGISNEISVVVNPTPTPTISTDDSIEWLEGETISVNLTVDIADADSYQWYMDDEPIDNTTLNTFEATTGGTYYVEVTVGECIGISNSITITVNPIPTYTVTFTVTNASSVALENAEIVIESLDAIYTDVDGIATIDLPNGTYNFVVNADNFEAYSSSFVVDGVALDIPVELIGVGIDQNEMLSVKAFPNPFSNSIRISNPELVNRVVISNIAGQKILEITLDGQDIINTQALPVGVYVVRIIGHNDKTAIYRMIKE